MPSQTAPLTEEVAAEIKSILVPLREKRETLTAEADTLKARLAVVTAGIRAINKILVQAEPKESNGSKPKKKGKTGSSAVSKEKLNQVLAVVREMPPDFTMGMVAAKLAGTMSDGSVKNALDQLREMEVVKRTGQPKVGQHRQFTHVYEPEHDPERTAS